MCTAIQYRSKDTYFGRSLDYDFSYEEEVVVTPRGYKFPLRSGSEVLTDYAIIGVAYVQNNFPLYYDAVNEKGLAIAGLKFGGTAHYFEPKEGKTNIASFELIPWLLGTCANITELLAAIKNLNITNLSFAPELPAVDLHWIISDPTNCIVMESTKTGLHIYNNPARTLTNNPSFDKQLFRLNDYASLSPASPVNRFSGQLNLEEYSRGMGAIGLPGDLSSTSRFIRTTFMNLNSLSPEDEASSVSQFFHILDTAAQPRGCCDLGEGKYEISIYTSCYNLQKGICYYISYDNRQITAIDMHQTDLADTNLTRFPFIKEQNINYLTK